MFYLLLAILSSAMVSIAMRLSTKQVSGSVSVLAMNYVMCIAIAAAYTGVGNLLPRAEGIGLTLGMGVINGILYLAGFVLHQMNVKKNGVVLSATFMKLGLLVSMAASVFLFGEIPEPLQIVGFLIAVVAIVLINLEKNQANMQFKAGLVLVLVVGGVTDTMAKVYEVTGSSELSSQFLFYTFVVAFLCCMGLVVLKKEKIGRNEVLFGMLIGIPNYFSARFLLLALEHVPAVIVYPTVSVATLLVVTLVGVGFFKEKLARRQWAALGIILVALVLLNI